MLRPVAGYLNPNTQAQNTQTQITQNPKTTKRKILKIQIAVLVKYLTASWH